MHGEISLGLPCALDTDTWDFTGGGKEEKFAPGPEAPYSIFPLADVW